MNKGGNASGSLVLLDEAAFYYFMNCRSCEMITLRAGDCTGAERNLAPKRPAAGGESCEAGFILKFWGKTELLSTIKEKENENDADL